MCLRWIHTSEDVALDAKSLIVDVHKRFNRDKAKKTLVVSVNRLAARICAALGVKKATLSITYEKKPTLMI